MAQEPNRNRKPEPSEPFFLKPKVEPELPEPFSRNQNRNRNRPSLLNCTETQKAPFCRGTARTENWTARTVLPTNCNRTEPNRATLKRSFCRKILVSVKFVSAILGLEMAAPILRTPGKCVLSAGKPMSIKFLVLAGGNFRFGRGGQCRFYFYGRGDFSEFVLENSVFNAYFVTLTAHTLPN